MKHFKKRQKKLAIIEIVSRVLAISRGKYAVIDKHHVSAASFSEFGELPIVRFTYKHQIYTALPRRRKVVLDNYYKSSHFFVEEQKYLTKMIFR